MRQAGIAGPYTYTTTTYDGDCLAKFGLLKFAINAGENYGLKAAAAAGNETVALWVGRLTSTPATAAFVMLAGYAVFQECKCHEQ